MIATRLAGILLFAALSQASAPAATFRLSEATIADMEKATNGALFRF